jgi:hypothetical protein
VKINDSVNYVAVLKQFSGVWQDWKSACQQFDSAAPRHQSLPNFSYLFGFGPSLSSRRRSPFIVFGFLRLR